MGLLDLINTETSSPAMTREEFKTRLVPQEIRDMLAIKKEKTPITMMAKEGNKSLELLARKSELENTESDTTKDSGSDDFMETLMERFALAEKKKKEDRIKKIIKLLLN